MLKVVEQVKNYFEKNKIPKFRYKQFENDYFNQYISSFEEITVFPKYLRENLTKEIVFRDLEIIKIQKNEDTIKFLLKTIDNQFIETVLMIYAKRRTLCLSSQIFCAMGCTFCATGANKFKRNLSSQEIIEQVLIASNYLKNELGKDERVTNIVYMGMGEPFLNYANVVESIKILNSPDYFKIGARHITVSTCGIIPKIEEFMNLNLQIRLAISLHAPNDNLRTVLMPINKTYPLKDLIETTDKFSLKTNKKVSFEYVLIKDINDKKEHAKELSLLLKDKLAHVNLLVYNPHKFSIFQKPDLQTVQEFKKVLDQNNIECSIRKSLGDNIEGACGQLSGNQNKNC